MSGAQHVLSATIGAAAALAATCLVGATRQPPRAAVLDVERINIREPDGTLRMVLSGAAREPGIVVDGHEQPHPNRRSAGILFYNDEGTENGGLIFDGRRDAAGQPHSSGSLTFDRYRQDQLVQLQATEDGGQRHGGLIVNDHPDAPIDYPAVARALTLPPPEQPAAFRAANIATTRRVFVGRTAEGASELQLKDAAGASRLILTVDPAGQAAILFLDARGEVQRRIAMR